MPSSVALSVSLRHLLLQLDDVVELLLDLLLLLQVVVPQLVDVQVLHGLQVEDLP